MLIPPRQPNVPVQTEQSAMAGGLDVISPPGLARSGTCRFAQNYELEFGGGYRRMGGIERYDGQPSPSAAAYVVLYAEDGFSLVPPGALLVGATSGAEGVAVYQSADLKTLGLTRLLPGFNFEAEDLNLGGSSVGTITNAAPLIDSFDDNDVAYAAAEEYRRTIAKPPGTGAIRGVAVIDNTVFAWRDNGTAMRIWRATPTGWEQVDLLRRIFFTGGTVAYPEGSNLVQGSRSAVVRRVVVTGGTWAAGTAEGFFVINAPTGAGAFVAGAATGGGACDLTGPDAAQSLLAGGRVVAVPYNFTGSTATRRLYGCDGVNPEFEFDGEVWVPIETGMGTVRARHAFVHKNQLVYAYGSSLQHSAPGQPFVWSAIFGAAELTTGDTITGFINVSGSESNAALLVTCRDSVWALYGDGVSSWKFVRISDEAGAQAYSGLNILGPVAFDRNGFNRYSPTDSFGNFALESASRQIEPLVRNAVVLCSVLIKDKSKMRCFFSDGSFVTGTPTGNVLAWMAGSYDRIINVAVGAEIDGQYRIFLGDSAGWVLEADVGRSYDGAEIAAGLRLSSQTQGSPLVEKQFRQVEVQTEASSSFRLAMGAEFSDSDPRAANVDVTSMQTFRKQFGAGLFWDFNAWDQAYWDGALANRLRYSIRGKGKQLSLLFSSRSDRELPHTIKTTTVVFTPRRMTR